VTLPPDIAPEWRAEERKEKHLRLLRSAFGDATAGFTAFRRAVEEAQRSFAGLLPELQTAILIEQRLRLAAQAENLSAWRPWR
jgi:hypothetical protein